MSVFFGLWMSLSPRFNTDEQKVHFTGISDNPSEMWKRLEVGQVEGELHYGDNRRGKAT